MAKQSIKITMNIRRGGKGGGRGGKGTRKG